MTTEYGQVTQNTADRAHRTPPGAHRIRSGVNTVGYTDRAHRTLPGAYRIVKCTDREHTLTVNTEYGRGDHRTDWAVWDIDKIRH